MDARYRFLMVAVVACCTSVAVSAQNFDYDIYKIGERRRLAEAKVNELKSTVKEGDSLEPVHRAYSAAMAKHNAWFDLIATSILQKRKKLDTPEYRQVVQETASSFATFDTEANKLLYPTAATTLQAVTSSVVTAGLVGEIVGELIRGGIAFWNAKKNLDDIRRKEAVKFLEGRAQWPTWDAIKGCSTQ